VIVRKSRKLQNEDMTGKNNAKTYKVLVTVTLTSQGNVVVRANSPEKARELAEEQFDCADYDDGTRETQSVIVADDGSPVDAGGVAEPWTLLYASTRRMAIADGVLVDVTATAA
jgi:hypothetical protein